MRPSPQTPRAAVSCRGPCSSTSPPPSLRSQPWNNPAANTATTIFTTTTATSLYSHSSNAADLVDDDLFGSVAWKRRRAVGKRGGKKATRKALTDDHQNSATDRKRWFLVKLTEQRVRDLGGQLSVVREWLTIAYTRLFESASVASAGGEQNGRLAVPVMNGSPGTVTAMPGNYDLTSEAIVQQARLLCSSYIHNRLSSKGLMSKRVPVAPSQSPLAEELWSAGRELERLYPRIYSDVSRRICLTMSSAQIVRRALTVVLEGIFKTGVTWARVVAMVAIAAAFAEECVVQGHAGFVEDVVMCVGHFVSLHLTDWLVRQGGWSAFPSSRPLVVEKPTDCSPLLSVSLAVVAIALLLVLLSKLLLDGT